MIGAAILLMAFSRAGRIDWIARIDATIVGVGVGVVLAVFLWPKMVDADLTGEGVVIVALALGVLTGLIATGVRLALTGRLPAPIGPVPRRGGAGHGGRRGCVPRQPAAVHRRRPWIAWPPASGSSGRCCSRPRPSTPQRLVWSTVSTSRPTSCRRCDWSLLVAAAGAGPATAVVQQLVGEAVDGVALGATTTILVVLLAARLQLVVRAGQVQAGRERTDPGGRAGLRRSPGPAVDPIRRVEGGVAAGDRRPALRRVGRDQRPRRRVPARAGRPRWSSRPGHGRHRRRPRPALEPRRGRRSCAGQHRRRGRGGADPEPARRPGGDRCGRRPSGARTRSTRAWRSSERSVRSRSTRSSRARSCTRSAARPGSDSSCVTAAMPCSSSVETGASATSRPRSCECSAS